jgi:diguanylate cyclase (GGDEF)-like protein/PAS domain S-box-containing protein
MTEGIAVGFADPPAPRQAREVVAAVFHAVAADPVGALLVLELGGDVTEPIVRWSNLGAGMLLGMAGSDVEGARLSEFLTGRQGTSLTTMFRRERSTSASVTIRTSVGQTVYCVVKAAPTADDRLWTLQIEPAHSARELALRASADAHERRFRVLAERSPVPTMMSDQGMRLGHVNDALCTLLAVPADDLLGTGWMAYAHEDDAELITDAVVAVLGGGQEREIQARFVDSRRHLHHTALRFTPIHTPGVGDGFVATVEDVTERRVLEQQLNHQATHDTLTELPRRNRLWDHIAAAMQDPGAGLACMFLDLDNFKIVNDSLGHNAGDALLVEIAKRLSKAVRSGDLVARFGGDEFVIAAGTGSLDVALEIANRIMRVLAEPVVLEGVAIRAKGSIGVVLRGPDHRTPDDIIRDCDIAMYEAKSRGKGRVVVLDEAARGAAYDTLQLVSELRDAIEDRHITLSYQPIVRRTGSGLELLSVEALARWKHYGRGALSPEVFVKLAEENGLIHELGQLVMDTACAAMAGWQRDLGELGPPRINVNLSVLQMGDDLLVPSVKEMLERYGLRPQQLCLEITESALMRDPDTASSVVAQLRDHGVQVAIDDFGTGFS